MRAPCCRSHRAPPAHVSAEEICPDLRLRSPYRGIVTGRSILRLRVVIAPRGIVPHEVIIEVDDLAVEVHEEAERPDGWPPAAKQGLVVDAGAIDTLFVVERQPRHGFLTWFGVFARSRGRADCLLFETPESKVAQFVERAIEERLGLSDEPVRGQLRLD